MYLCIYIYIPPKTICTKRCSCRAKSSTVETWKKPDMWYLTWLTYDRTHVWHDLCVTWLMCDMTHTCHDSCVTWHICDINVYHNNVLQIRGKSPTCDKGWRICIRCLKLQVLFRERAMIIGLFGRMIYKDKTSCASSQPCIWHDFHVTWLTCDMTHIWHDSCVTRRICVVAPVWQWPICDIHVYHNNLHVFTYQQIPVAPPLYHRVVSHSSSCEIADSWFPRFFHTSPERTKPALCALW